MLSASTYSKPLYTQSEALERECEAYSEHIQNALSDNIKLSKYLPFPQTGSKVDNLLDSLRDGVLLSFMIESLKPGAVGLSRLNYNIEMTKVGQKHSKALFEIGENLNACIEGAKKLKEFGVVIVNLGSNDILEKNVDIVLGLVWQIIRAHLLRYVNLVDHPALIRLLEPGETLKDLVNMNSEKILLRWMNYHLKKEGLSKISNFSTDIADGTKYIALFKQVTPVCKNHDKLNKAMECAEEHDRIKLILEFAETLGLRKFVSIKDVIAGHARLNMAFVAGIFNKYIGIHLPSDKEIRKLYARMDELEEENVRLKNELAVKEGEIETIMRQVEDFKLEWQAQQNALVTETQKRVQDMQKEHRNELMEKEREVTEKLKLLKVDMDSSLAQRENEMKSIVDALKAKHKQQLYSAERDNVTHIHKIVKELSNVKNCMEDFMLSNNIDFKPNDSIKEIDEYPLQFESYLAQIFGDYHKKAEVADVLKKKLEHLEHVNDVYGDKIQEYAESKVQERKKKGQKAKGFFDLDAELKMFTDVKLIPLREKKDFDALSEKIIKKTQNTLEKIKELKSQLNLEKSLTPRIRKDERSHLLDLKRIKTGVDELSKAELAVIQKSRETLETIDQFQNQVWKDVKKNYLLTATKDTLIKLSTYNQPTNIAKKKADSISKLFNKYMSLLENIELEGLEQIINEANGIIVDIGYELKRGVEQISHLELKFERYYPIILEDFNYKFSSTFGNETFDASLFPEIRFPSDRFRSELAAVKTDDLEMLVNIFIRTKELVSLEIESKHKIEAIISALKEQRREWQNTRQRDVFSFEESLRTVEMEIRNSRSRKEVGIRAENLLSKLSEFYNWEYKYHGQFQEILQLAQNSMNDLESEIAKKRELGMKEINNSIDQLLEKNTVIHKVKNVFNKSKWCCLENKERADQEISEMVFQTQNDLNSNLYKIDLQKEYYTSKFIPQRLEYFEEQTKQQDQLIKDLADELLNIRFDFDAKFKNVAIIIQDYVKEVESTSSVLLTVPRSNVREVGQTQKQRVYEYLKHLSFILKDATDDFQNRYDKIKKYQLAAASDKAEDSTDIAKNSMEQENTDELLSNREIWERALQITKEKTADLKIEYAKLTTIRLKDWLSFYQKKFYHEQELMREASDRFDDLCIRLNNEVLFIDRIESGLENFDRTLKNEIRLIKATVSLVTTQITDRVLSLEQICEIQSALVLQDNHQLVNELKSTTLNELSTSSIEFYERLTHVPVRKELRPALSLYQDHLKSRVEETLNHYHGEKDALTKEITYLSLKVQKVASDVFLRRLQALLETFESVMLKQRNIIREKIISIAKEVHSQRLKVYKTLNEQNLRECPSKMARLRQFLEQALQSVNANDEINKNISEFMESLSTDKEVLKSIINNAPANEVDCGKINELGNEIKNEYQRLAQIQRTLHAEWENRMNNILVLY